MCGIFGVCGYKEAAIACKDGLYQIQHRGEDGCGLASFDLNEGEIHSFKDLGEVEAVLTDDVLGELTGALAIGHTRYPTSGIPSRANTQPHLTFSPPAALCANGDILQFCLEREREKLLTQQIGFEGHNDGEVLVKFIAACLQRGMPLQNAIKELMQTMVGCYSALMLYDGQMVAFRDPLGIRPLSIGRRDKTFLVSSETCAFDIVEGDYIREVEPGEMVIFSTGHQPQSLQLISERCHKHCIFELIYFARPDSIVFGIPAYYFRKRLGALIATQIKKLNVDFVVPVPDSSNVAALGFSQAMSLPFELALIRNHYIGREFIRPGQKRRDESMRKKHNPVRPFLKGKRLAVMDDSILRGTAIRKIISMLRRAGVAEIIVISSAPRICSSCFYGIDTKQSGQLIAASKTTEQTREYIGADGLFYPDVSTLRQTIKGEGADPDHFCYACFTGEYPTAIAA